MAHLDPRKRKILLAGLAAYFILDSESSTTSTTLFTAKPRPLSTDVPKLPISSPGALLTAAMHNATVTASGTVKPHPTQGGQRITRHYLDKLSDAECVWRFRFTADELVILAHALDLPDPLITARGYHACAIECLGLLCARLRSPEDQWSLSTKYGRPQSAISEITNETATYLNERWGHLLEWDDKALLTPNRMREYARAVQTFGAPASTIFGFIDCTIRATCRPGMDQELAYTGYKKCHGMKFQAIVIPNGLIAHLSGPYRAPQNDLGVFAESGLKEMLEEHAIQPGSRMGDPPAQRFFQVYGDSAYGASPTMVSPYSGTAVLTPEQRAWNHAMGQVRISVEHGFGLVVQDWPYLNCYWKHKIWGNQCGTLYRVGVLLTNTHACLVPNQTAVRYQCPPPSLAEYLHD